MGGLGHQPPQDGQAHRALDAQLAGDRRRRADATGAYLYDAAANALQPLVAGDLRALTGTQDFVKDAPVTLVLVADTSRMKGGPDTQAYA